MPGSTTNENEGADPSGDIENQNRGSEDRAGAGEGPDADSAGKAKDEGEQSGDHDKAQNLAKAGRDDFDPNAGQE